MTSQSLAAGAVRFAHFVGLVRASTDDDDQDDGVPKDGKKDGKKTGTTGESDTTDDGDESSGDNREGAAADDDAPACEGDDNDQNDGEPAKDGKKSKKKGDASDGDDDPADSEDQDADEEMRGASATAKARMRENRRCAAIFACPQAATNLPLAVSLDFETRLPRREAIAVLKRGGAVNGRAGRAASNPDVGTGGSPSGGAKVQGMWAAAFKKAGVKLAD
jgi:hypothetical protein